MVAPPLLLTSILDRLGLAVIGGALLVSAAIMCGEQDPGERPSGEPMPKAAIETVLKEHTDILMSLPGVVGTGRGECDGRPCIRVFVVEKTPELMRKIPSSLEGYAVEVEETGEIRARD